MGVGWAHRLAEQEKERASDWITATLSDELVKPGKYAQIQKVLIFQATTPVSNAGLSVSPPHTTGVMQEKTERIIPLLNS